MDYYYDGSLSSNDLGLAAFFGAFTGFTAVLCLVFAILQIIATWRIFTKAGEEGWKSIIPIYNLVILYKISGMSPWLVLIYLCSFIPVIGFLGALALTIVQEVKLCKNFGKGSGFTVGMVLLPSIFSLILGFDSSKFVGEKYDKNNSNNNSGDPENF